MRPKSLIIENMATAVPRSECNVRSFGRERERERGGDLALSDQVLPTII